MKARVREDLRKENCCPPHDRGNTTLEENEQTFLSYQPDELDNDFLNTVIVVNWDSNKPTKVYLVNSIDLEFIDEA